MTDDHSTKPRAETGPETLNTGRVYLWVDRRWMVDVHYLTEGFEGLFVPTTLDKRMGLVRLTVASGGEEAAGEVIDLILKTYDGIRLAGTSGPKPPSPPHLG